MAGDKATISHLDKARFQRWVTREACTDPLAGKLAGGYLADELSDQDRVRFWQHKRRCLACSVKVSNQKFIEAAAEFTGLAIGDPRLEDYIVEVECPMPAALFAMTPELMNMPMGKDVPPRRRKAAHAR